MSADKVAKRQAAKAEDRFLRAQAAEDSAWEAGNVRERIRATEIRFRAELEARRARTAVCA